ncbi:conserved hypothetical protein [Rhodopseudomonas palustris TIE-1]|uniref:gene transfer agent family protein n=1 Tax=Rhodopseudomonas palustris TaxID=1076 RepID=UPI000164B491|nr:gene transfer agent family protein [Rhodopseudomonas palustris]ACF02487.1 conserved hypothetical protein [Rhodopseudomonas palustris TIE-1]
MTSECARTLAWAGSQHTFNLDHPWVRSFLAVRGLPGDNGSSPAACLWRFQQGHGTEEDVARVIELGLIGAGKTRSEAAALVRDNIRSGPLSPHIDVAAAVLSALFVGQGA